MVDGLFALLNRDSQVEQLAAMDAIGLLREASAVSSLSERYQFYRKNDNRALAGGALEALARIGDPSSVVMVRQLTGDKWAEGQGRHRAGRCLCARATVERRIDRDDPAGS